MLGETSPNIVRGIGQGRLGVDSSLGHF
jgi:hypothetical protein